MSTENLDKAEKASSEQATQIVEESKDGEDKDGFVIVDNSYLDSVSELHPLSNLSDFSRVNPQTAQTDFKHLPSMLQTFLIGPHFKPKPPQTPNRGA